MARSPASSSDSASENRHALHTPFCGGAPGAVRDELILRVPLDALDAQPRPFDGRAVLVLLRGAADACCPEIRVAHDAFRQRRLGDDVGDGETSTALEEA